MFKGFIDIIINLTQGFSKYNIIESKLINSQKFRVWIITIVSLMLKFKQPLKFKGISSYSYYFHISYKLEYMLKWT